MELAFNLRHTDQHREQSQTSILEAKRRSQRSRLFMPLIMSSIDVIIPIRAPPSCSRIAVWLLVGTDPSDFKVTIVDDGSTLEEFQNIQEIAKEFRQKGLNINVIRMEERKCCRCEKLWI